MCPMRYYILSPLTEAAISPKGRKILWNDALEDYFKELKHMVFKKNLLSYASYKQLGAGISQNNKHTVFFLIIISKPQRNYTMTKKELLSIVECLKRLLEILFGYEINEFPDHKNLIYAATLGYS